MKKFIGLFGVIFLMLLFMSAVKPAQASEMAGGCSSSATNQSVVDGGNIAQQYLKPTKDVITSITVKGAASAIFEVTLELQKFKDNALERPPIISRTFVRNVTGEMPYDLVVSGLSLNLDKNSFYAITVFANSGTYYPYYDTDQNCDPVGYGEVSLSNYHDDAVAYFTGHDNAIPSASVAETPSAATNQSNVTNNSTAPISPSSADITTTTAVAEAPVASIITTPLNFKVDRNLGEEIIFSWQTNTEADLSGYVLTIYEGENVVLSIDIADKDLDNYNLILKDQPLLRLDTHYAATLMAKNASGAVSAGTEQVRFTFEKREAAQAVTTPWYKSPLILALIVLAIIVILGISQWKWKVFSKLLQKFSTSKQ